MKIAEIYTEITTRDVGFNAGITRAQRLAHAASKSFDLMARMAKYAFLGLAGAAGTSVAIMGGFEQRMARVKALSNATGAEFSMLGVTARELGKQTVYTASQAAEAMGNFALAGFRTQEIIAAMPATLNLAAAGQLDMATASSISSKIMKGMGIQASELAGAADILAKAFTTSNTDLVQLGDAMKYVGPIGRQTSKGLEELTAVIQVMSNAGIQGQMAGTSLRNILTRLSGGVVGATKIMDDLGISISDSSKKMLPLADIVDNFNSKTAQMDEMEKTSVIMRTFGMRAGPAMAALLSEGGDAIRKFEKSLQGAGGTAKRIADIQMDTLFGSFVRFKSAMQEIAIQVGSVFAPSLRFIADVLTENSSVVYAWVDKTRAALVNSLAYWVEFYAKVEYAVKNFELTFGVVFETASLYVQSFALDVEHWLKTAASFWSTIFKNMYDNAVNFWSNILQYPIWFFDNLKTFLTNAANFWKTIFSNMADNVVAIFSNLKGLIAGTIDFDEIWKPLTDGFKKAIISDLPEFKYEPKGLTEGFDNADRKITETEKKAQASINRMVAMLKSGGEKRAKELLKFFGLDHDETKKNADESAQTISEAMQNITPTEIDATVKTSQEGTGGKSGIAEFVEKIQVAALGSKSEKLMQQQVGLQQQIAEQGKTTNTLLQQMSAFNTIGGLSVGT